MKINRISIQDNYILFGFNKILISDIKKIEYKKVFLIDDLLSKNRRGIDGIIVDYLSHNKYSKKIAIPSSRYYDSKKLEDAIMEMAIKNNIPVSNERGEK